MNSLLLLMSWLAVTIDAQAFSVASTDTFTGEDTLHVPFNVVLYNDGSYNETSNGFECTVDGVYYYSFSAGLEAGMGAQMVLQRNLNVGAEITNYDTNTDAIGVSSRGVFNNIQAGTLMRMVAVIDENRSLSLQGDPLTRQTSWTAFRYNELAEVDIAFSVAKTSNLSLGQGPLLFDSQILNIGTQESPFNMSSGIFTAQRAGVYFFHISAGAQPQSEVRINVTRNDPGTQMASLYRTSRIHNGVDTLSRNLLVDLELGDQVYVINGLGSELFSNGGYQTSFSGFLYATTFQTGPAFMAYRSQNWQESVTEAIRYDTVEVNKGQGYNQFTSVFTCQVAGEYFFSLSAGAMPFTPVTLSLHVNSQTMLQLVSRSSVHNGIDTISRDVILYLEVDDVVHVEADGGTGLFSDVGGQTSFMGFRIRG